MSGEEAEREFSVEIDGASTKFKTGTVTGLEIMEAAKIPVATGLLEVLEDGTQRQVRPEETFDLEKGPKFKTPPKFKRG